MGNNFKALQTIQDRGFLNVDDFYSITVTEYSIRLQGQYSSKLIRDYSQATYKGHDLVFTTDSNGHMVGEITIDDVRLHLTFTD